MPGIVDHGNDVDLSANQDVVHPIWEVSERRPPDVEVNDLIEARILLNQGNNVFNFLKEGLS